MVQNEAGTHRSHWPRSFWFSVGIYVLFNCLFLALVLIKPGAPRQFTIADDTGQALGWLIASLLCLVGFQWRQDDSSSSSMFGSFLRPLLRWVPLLLALGIFCQFLGQLIYTYYDFRGLSDFPSLADAGYLCTFPFFFLAIGLLPTRSLSGITRARVVVDGFLTMIALITFSWYFVLGPTMLQGNETTFAKIVGSAYPFFDLVLIYCVLRLSFRSDDPALQPVIRLLSLGFLIIVITDTIYDYQTLQMSYVNGWQDVGWPLGYMLIGLAAQALNIIRRREQRAARQSAGQDSLHSATIPSAAGWPALIPYALVPAVTVLLIYVWRTGANDSLARGVYVGGLLLFILILLRQFIAIRETAFYNRELQRAQSELSINNRALHIANIQLEEQAAQLDAAYKQQVHLNELKDQFLFNVNHELRTPLTTIYGYLDLLQQYHDSIDESTRKAFIDLAAQGCEELQHLVGNVLDTIRGDIGKEPQLSIFPAIEVAREAVDLVEPQKRLAYQIEIDVPEMLILKADRLYTRRILVNLLSNALKYSPPLTSIIISATCLNPVDGQAGGSEQIRLCVQDSGPGIPPSEIPILFGKFVRLERDLSGSVRGTGLGLYISKQLVEAMNGHIWVESTGVAGEGSRFYVTLPSAAKLPDTTIVEQPQLALPMQPS